MQPGSDTLAPRGKLTWLLFGVGACFSYLLTGIGSILAPLQDELGVSRSEVALLPTLFAAALVAVGLVGGRIVVWVGRQRSLRGAMIGVAIGATLVAGPGWPLALLGATVLGASCALLVLLMPVLINALHPRRTTAIIAEQNAVNSFASVLAPLLVGAALATGLGWRPGYLAPALLLLLFVPFVRDIPAPRVRLERDRTPDRNHVRSGLLVTLAGHPARGQRGVLHPVLDRLGLLDVVRPRIGRRRSSGVPRSWPGWSSGGRSAHP